MIDSSYRWTSKRKAAEVEAVMANPQRLLELQRDHGVSAEEFGSWRRLYTKDGVEALRATRLQQYRARPKKMKPVETKMKSISLVTSALALMVFAGTVQAAPGFCTGTVQVVSSGASVPGSFLLNGTGGSSGNCVEAGDKFFGAFSVSGAITGAGSSTFSFQMTPGNVTLGFQGNVGASSTGGVNYSAAIDPLLAQGFLIDDLQKDFTFNSNVGVGPATATLTGTAAGVNFTCTRSVDAGGTKTSTCPVEHSFGLTSQIDVTESLTVGANTTVTALTDSISQALPSIPEPTSLALLGTTLVMLGLTGIARRWN